MSVFSTKEQQISELFTSFTGEPEYLQRKKLDEVYTADEAVTEKLNLLKENELRYELEDLIATSNSQNERDGFIQGFLYAVSLSRLWI